MNKQSFFGLWIPVGSMLPASSGDKFLQEICGTTRLSSIIFTAHTFILLFTFSLFSLGVVGNSFLINVCDFFTQI